MSQFHVAQAACASPLIAALKDAGAPVDRLLTHSGLHRFRIDDPGAWIPAECLHKLFELVARRETGPELPPEISSRYVMANMGGFGSETLQVPDLRTLFLLVQEAPLCTYANLTLSLHGVNSRITTDIEGPKRLSRQWHEVMCFALMIDSVRAAAGSDWRPAAMHVSDSNPGEVEAFLSDQTAVSNSGETFSIDLPTIYLAGPLTAGQSLDQVGPGPRIGNGLADRVKAVLDASTNDVVPTVEMVSEISGVSVRTLQRRLREEGLTFFDVVDRWRFNRALDLIMEPRVTITEMAQSARYSHASHFIRAFKRWTGVTPQSFRDSLPTSP